MKIAEKRFLLLHFTDGVLEKHFYDKLKRQCRTSGVTLSFCCFICAFSVFRHYDWLLHVFLQRLLLTEQVFSARRPS